jgi:hypothetical protein
VAEDSAHFKAVHRPHVRPAANDNRVLVQADCPERQIDPRPVLRDPQFASAHILLAHAMATTGSPWPQVLEQATQARAVASTVSEVERYFIEGSYFSFEARAHPTRFRELLEQSTSAYEALLHLEPNHYWAANN